MMVVIAISGALAPTYRAQVNSLTRIYSVPSGATFYVDGQAYMQGTAAAWLIGSRHVLWVQNDKQDYVLPGTRYRFTGWSGRKGGFDGNPITVTAAVDETEYRANFDVEYLLRFQFAECGRGGCENGGVIQGDGGGAVSGSEMWVKAGSELKLTAASNPGYVFVGWRVGPSQVIQGVDNRLTVKSPVTVIAQFQPVRAVQVLTSPENMQVLVDHAPARAPYSSEWGWTTPHTLDVVSPQQDGYGKTWVFDSWSDGGIQQHIYNVAENAEEPLVFTAKFVPGAGVTLATSPPGLNLIVDGQTTAPPYYYWWREQERHTVKAPARQTDQNGKTWTFTGWSNGAADALQEITVPQEGVRLVANYALVGRITIHSTLAEAAIQVDGANCATPCSIEREVGSELRLSASSTVAISEGTRADFAGWTGSGASADREWTIKLNGDPQAVWANYSFRNRLLAISEPAGGARWTMTPAPADGFYDAGSTVNVAVSASPGYEFLRFEGDLNGIAKQGVLSMSSPRSVRAVFDRTPFVQPNGVVNGAGVTPDAVVAAGSVVSVYGASLSEESVVGPGSPMSQTLAGVTVRIGDRLAPLFFVSPNQINLQLPDLTPGTYTVTVSPFGSKDVTAAFTVARNAPGVFQRADLDKQIALAMHEDGSVVSAASPARRGELLLLYGTGFGPLNRPRLAGLAIPETPAFTVTDPVELLLGDTVVRAEQAYAAPALVGVDVARFRIPDAVPAGVHSLRVRINQRESNTVALPVQ